jgi:hypothetical protein
MYLRDRDRRLRGIGAIASRDAYRERIPGGRAAGRHPRQFDPRELARGTEVELEHTYDRGIAREIAMDHLAEDPRYYQKLALIETAHHQRRFASPMGGTGVSECYLLTDGTYYVRRASGVVEKVSPQEAMRFPSCTQIGPSSGATPMPMPMRLRAGALARVSAAPVAERISTVVRPPGPATSQPMTPATVAMPSPTPSATPSPSITTYPGTRPPLPPPPKVPTKAVAIQTAVTTTAPQVTSAPSVSTAWLPPVRPAPIPAPIEPPAPADLEVTPAPAAAISSRTKNLVLLGAGIGLAYLFTRKRS